WVAQLMHRIDCRSGHTQIGRVFSHALRESERGPVQALIFIGDAMEEDLETLTVMAAKLGGQKVPIFMFQGGRDAVVRKAFRLFALKSGGEFFEFNPDRPQAVAQLSSQLNAVARLAVGDAEALKAIGHSRG